MTNFEKIVVPLIDENIRSIDLTSAAGFIDSYTYDPDNPTGSYEFYLVYDDSVRNEFSKDRAIRFEKSKNIKKIYIKYVNGKPCCIYSFWVRPEVKKLYNGIITLTTAQKLSVLQFWTVLDSVANLIMSNQVVTLDVTHDMPLEDYREDAFSETGLTIYKKETVSNEAASFYYFCLYRMILYVGFFKIRY